MEPKIEQVVRREEHRDEATFSVKTRVGFDVTMNGGIFWEIEDYEPVPASFWI